jgi:hypothetical protein
MGNTNEIRSKVEPMKEVAKMICSEPLRPALFLIAGKLDFTKFNACPVNPLDFQKSYKL